MSTVKVLDEQNQVLFECQLNEAEKAWAYARQMEDYGVAVKITSPSLPESLVEALGASQEEIAGLRFELDEEIDSHIGCCNDHNDE